MASTAVSLLPAPLGTEEAARKILARFIPHNPLISLDSDERIQGNPSEPNSHKLGFWRQNGHGPRKPKLDRIAVEKEQPRGPSKHQAPLRTPRAPGALVEGYVSSSPGSGFALPPGMT
jgi:hypothetical protein